MSPNKAIGRSFFNRSAYAAAGVAFLIIGGYTLFVLMPYLLGPSLSITTPSAYSTNQNPALLIQGTTKRVSYLSINDQPVPLLEDGTFAVTRSYPQGYTVLVIRARDRFNREVRDTISFVNDYTHGQNIQN